MGEQKRRGEVQPTPEEKKVIEGALGLAQSLETVLAGHDGRSCVLAVGWALGAFAADTGMTFPDLDTVIVGLRREAHRKFAGVRDGTWPNANPFDATAGRA